MLKVRKLSIRTLNGAGLAILLAVSLHSLHAAGAPGPRDLPSLLNVVSLHPEHETSWRNHDLLIESVKRLAAIAESQDTAEGDRDRIRKVLNARLESGPLSPVKTANRIEDIIIQLFGGAPSQSSVWTSANSGQTLIADVDPEVRRVTAIWIGDRFVGYRPNLSFFPYPSSAFKAEYNDVDFSNLVFGERFGWRSTFRMFRNYVMLSPTGKMLSVLSYNAENDSNKESREAAGKAWTSIRSALQRALMEDGDGGDNKEDTLASVQLESIRANLAEFWLSEVQEVHQEWARQRTLEAKDESSHATSAKFNDLRRALAEMGVVNESMKGIRGYPPLPPYACETLLHRPR